MTKPLSASPLFEMSQQPISISPYQPLRIDELVQAARTKPPILGRRALAVLLIAAGQPSKEVATKLGVNARTVRRWIENYNGNGLDRLYNNSPFRFGGRPGNPVTEEDIRRALEGRPPWGERWSISSLRSWLHINALKPIKPRTLLRQLKAMGLSLRELPAPPPRVLSAEEREEAAFRERCIRLLGPGIEQRRKKYEALFGLPTAEPRTRERKAKTVREVDQPRQCDLTPAITQNQPINPIEPQL